MVAGEQENGPQVLRPLSLAKTIAMDLPLACAAALAMSPLCWLSANRKLAGLLVVLSKVMVTAW